MKKLINAFAKEIRKNTGRTFVESIKLAKAFYKDKTLAEYNIEGFSYMYSDFYRNLGYSFEECLIFDGSILKKDNLTNWVIPHEFYEIKELYF